MGKKVFLRGSARDDRRGCRKAGLGRLGAANAPLIVYGDFLLLRGLPIKGPGFFHRVPIGYTFKGRLWFLSFYRKPIKIPVVRENAIKFAFRDSRRDITVRKVNAVIPV